MVLVGASLCEREKMPQVYAKAVVGGHKVYLHRRI
jgi:hypothetical protein